MRIRYVLLISSLAALLLWGVAFAQTSYQIRRWSVNADSTLMGGVYTLSGATGHPETQILEGGDYLLVRSSLGEGIPDRLSVYLPFVSR